MNRHTRVSRRAVLAGSAAATTFGFSGFPARAAEMHHDIYNGLASSTPSSQNMTDWTFYTDLQQSKFRYWRTLKNDWNYYMEDKSERIKKDELDEHEYQFRR